MSRTKLPGDAQRDEAPPDPAIASPPPPDDPEENEDIDETSAGGLHYPDEGEGGR